MFDPFGEPIFVERTETGVERAVVVDEDEGRLTADAVELPDIAVNVGGVGKVSTPVSATKASICSMVSRLATPMIRARPSN